MTIMGGWWILVGSFDDDDGKTRKCGPTLTINGKLERARFLNMVLRLTMMFFCRSFCS